MSTISTYDQFVTHVTAAAWQVNSADFANKIANYIDMAEQELRVTLDVDARNVTSTQSVTSQDWSGITDIDHIESVIRTDGNCTGVLQSTTLADVYAQRAQNANQYTPYYHFDNNTIRFVGPFTVSEQATMVVQYNSSIPNLQSAGSSFLTTRYLPLFTYTTLKHSGILRRENPDLWNNYVALAAEALENANTESKTKREFGGSPLTMQPHHPIPRRYRRY